MKTPFWLVYTMALVGITGALAGWVWLPVITTLLLAAMCRDTMKFIERINHD